MSWEAPGEASYQQWPPVEAGGVSRSSRRRLIGLGVGAVGASFVLTLLCGGAVILSMRAADGDLTRTPPVVAPTMAPPTVSPFSGHYAVPGNLCIGGDFTRLRPLFTHVDSIGAVSGPDAGGGVVRECGGVSGNDAISGRFRLVVAVYPDPAAAQAAFVAVVKSGPSEAVSGLGQAAYAYDDPNHGRTVIGIDENLTIAMSWRDAAQPTVDPEGLDQTLVDVCRSTMRLLRFG